MLLGQLLKQRHFRFCTRVGCQPLVNVTIATVSANVAQQFPTVLTCHSLSRAQGAIEEYLAVLFGRCIADCLQVSWVVS